MISKYKIECTTKFNKSYKKLIAKKGYNENDFIKVHKMLLNDEILPKQYHNHLLETKKNRIMGMSYKTRLVIDI